MNEWTGSNSDSSDQFVKLKIESYNKIMKIAIVGSRGFNDYNLLENTIQSECSKHDISITEVVSGGAGGADTLGEAFAKKNNIPTKIFKADWSKTRGAGIIRNIDIINYCDVCFAFWDGESKGTQSDIQLCAKQQKVCFIFNTKFNKLIVQENGSNILHQRSLDSLLSQNQNSATNIKVGNKVRHEKFGEGVVSKISDKGIAEIDFELYGKKPLLLSKANLEVID